MKTKTVCIKGGCYWLNGDVCSRECEHKRSIVDNRHFDITPPPDTYTRRKTYAWNMWASRSIRELRKYFERR